MSISVHYVTHQWAFINSVWKTITTDTVNKLFKRWITLLYFVVYPVDSAVHRLSQLGPEE